MAGISGGGTFLLIPQGLRHGAEQLGRHTAIMRATVVRRRITMEATLGTYGAWLALRWQIVQARGSRRIWIRTHLASIFNLRLGLWLAWAGVLHRCVDGIGVVAVLVLFSRHSNNLCLVGPLRSGRRLVPNLLLDILPKDIWIG